MGTSRRRFLKYVVAGGVALGTSALGLDLLSTRIPLHSQQSSTSGMHPPPMIKNLQWSPTQAVNGKVYAGTVSFEVEGVGSPIKEAQLDFDPIYPPEIPVSAFPQEPNRSYSFTANSKTATFSQTVGDLKGGKQYRALVGAADQYGSHSEASLNVPYVREFESIGQINKISIGTLYLTAYGPYDLWRPSNTTFTPLLGYYDSSNSFVQYKHSDWINGHGIGFIQLDWFGPYGFNNNDLRDVQIQRSLFDNPAWKDTQISVAYDISPGAKRFKFNPFVNLSDSVNRNLLFSDFDWLANNFFVKENYHRINGKPVVNITLDDGDARLTGDVKGVFSTLRQRMRDKGFDVFLIGDTVRYTNFSEWTRMSEPFDAISRFALVPFIYEFDDVGNFPPFSGTHVENSILNAADRMFSEASKFAKRSGKIFIPPVNPGFDNSHSAWGDNVHPRIKRSLEFYGKSIDLALKYIDENIPIVKINTFNDFGEDTFVEPTVQEGYDYLQTLRDTLAGQ